MVNWYYVGKMDYHAPNGADMKSPIPCGRTLCSEWRLWYRGWLSEHLMGYWCFKCNKAAIDCDGTYDCNNDY